MFDITFLSLNFDVGGSQRHTLDLARRLHHERGYAIRHIGTSVERPSPILTDEDRRDLVYLDRKGLGVIGMFRALFAELRARPTRILVGINQPPMTAQWLARALRVHTGPSIGIFHTTDLRTPSEERAQTLHTQTMKRLDRLIFVSEIQRHYWEARGLVSRGGGVILNGIEVDHFADARARWRTETRQRLGLVDDDFVIGLSARFRPEKNHVQLVEAIAALRARGVQAKALFVGSGPTEADCRARAEALGVSQFCVFAGEHDDVRPFIAAMDVGVLCSRSEALSLAALEIMSTGIPLVLSEVGGAAEIVEEGSNGFLFKVDDTPALTNHLARIAADPDLRRRMGARSTDIATHKFSYARMVREYVDLFEPYLKDGPVA